MVPVNLIGVFPIGPENFLCALMEWEEEHRYIPVWLPPIEGALLAARLGEWEPKRPDPYDVIAELLGHTTDSIAGIEITNYYQGTFYATLSLENGTEIDMRTSDALLLALVADVQVEMDETVLQLASIHIGAHDAMEYFGIEAEEPEPGLDPEAFEAFLRELEHDLGQDGDPFGGSGGGDQPSS